MLLGNLGELHLDMRNKSETRCVFPVRILGKGFSCIFLVDITPYHLYITSLGEAPFSIKYEISASYSITNTYLGDKYGALYSYLKLRGSSTEKYLPKLFLKDLDAETPIIFKKRPDYKEVLKIVRTLTKVDEADKIYFCGWRKNSNDENVSLLNYQKTVLVFGQEVADERKEKNISSRWSANPNDEHLTKVGQLPSN